MNEFERIITLKIKLNQLIESVSKNGGHFSSIDKDLFTGYVRELYEMGLSIQPSSAHTLHQESRELRTVTGREEIPYEEKREETKTPDIKETAAEKKDPVVKKTISEMYAQKNGGLNTVNERFKKQSPEIADKLKQTPIRDLKSFIGLNKRFAFIGTLFNDNETFYEEAVSKVNEFKSYEEAVNYIRSELLPKFQWEDEEPLVNEFFMLVMRRYLK